MQDAISANKSHQDYVDDYADREADIVSGNKPSTESSRWKKAYDYFYRPTKNDVGLGNVNTGRAILYLKGYLSEIGPGQKYEGDPLNLAQYGSNYRKLVRDLVDPQSDVTFKIAGLQIKHGDDVFANFYGNQYLTLPEDQQAALLTTAYKQGAPRIIRNYQNNPDLLVGAAVPTLSRPEAGDGAPFTLFNHPVFKKLLTRRVRMAGTLDPEGESAAAEAPNSGLNLPSQGANPAPGPIGNPWSGSSGAGSRGADSWGSDGQPGNAVRYPSSWSPSSSPSSSPSWPPSPDVRRFDPNLAAPSLGTPSPALSRPRGDLGGSFDSDRVDRWTGNAATSLPPTFAGVMPAGFGPGFGLIRSNDSSNDGGQDLSRQDLSRQDIWRQDLSRSAGVPSDPTTATTNTPWGSAYTSPMPFDPWNRASSAPWQVPSVANLGANGVPPTLPAQSPPWLQFALPSPPNPEIWQEGMPENVPLPATPLSGGGILGSLPIFSGSRGLLDLDPEALTYGASYGASYGPWA